jgi:hypothetical protein
MLSIFCKALFENREDVHLSFFQKEKYAVNLRNYSVSRKTEIKFKKGDCSHFPFPKFLENLKRVTVKKKL